MELSKRERVLQRMLEVELAPIAARYRSNGSLIRTVFQGVSTVELAKELAKLRVAEALELDIQSVYSACEEIEKELARRPSASSQ